MIPSQGQLPEYLRLRQLVLGGITTTGIETNISAINPIHLITNGAVYSLATDVTDIEGRVDTLETDLDALETEYDNTVDQDVRTTSRPSFEGITLSKGSLQTALISSDNVSRYWYELCDPLPNTDTGKFGHITITGRTGNNYEPIRFEYHIARQPLSYGGNFYYMYDAIDGNSATYPQFIVFRNPADGMIRIYCRPEINSRYAVIVTGNEFFKGNVENRSNGALPDNIDVTWVVLIDTDAGLPGPRTYPPNSAMQYGTLLLTSIAAAPPYALECKGPAYFNGDLLCNGVMRTNELRPSGLDSINSYQVGSGTLNVTGALVTTTQYRWTKLNNQITLRLIGVTGTAIATSAIILTLPAALSTSIPFTVVIDITDGAASDIGTANFNSVTVTIYKDGNGSSFQNGQPAGFKTFHITYFEN
jgi:hypothetical protein